MHEQITALAADIDALRGRSTPWSTMTVQGELLDALRTEVERQLSQPLAQSVHARRIAFADRDALIYPDSEEEATRLWGAGKTAILQSLQSEPGHVNLLAAHLQIVTGRRVSCSVYLAAAGADSFDYHVDEWDGALLQLSGEKLFYVMTDDGRSVNVASRPGELLFLPQGRKHRASTAKGSMHISVNILPT